MKKKEKKIVVKKNSEAEKFLTKMVKGKEKIREYIKEGKDLKELENEGIKLVQPI